MALQPTLRVDEDTGRLGSASVRVLNLDRDLVTFVGRHPQADNLWQSILRVTVVGAEGPGGEDLPDVLGRYRVLEDGVRFIPYFPFESGTRYRARFDPRPLGRPELSEVLSLDFSIPSQRCAVPPQVKHIFPTADCSVFTYAFPIQCSVVEQRNRSHFWTPMDAQRPMCSIALLLNFGTRACGT